MGFVVKKGGVGVWIGRLILAAVVVLILIAITNYAQRGKVGQPIPATTSEAPRPAEAPPANNQNIESDSTVIHRN